VVWLGWAWKTRVKRLLQFFTHLHNYETFRHIYTRQSSEQLDIFELAQGLHGKPLVGVVGQSDNPTSATIFTVYRKTGFPTNGAGVHVDNTVPNGVVQGKTCHSSNLVFWMLTSASWCVIRARAHI